MPFEIIAVVGGIIAGAIVPALDIGAKILAVLRGRSVEVTMPLDNQEVEVSDLDAVHRALENVRREHASTPA